MPQTDSPKPKSRNPFLEWVDRTFERADKRAEMVDLGTKGALEFREWEFRKWLKQGAETLEELDRQAANAGDIAQMKKVGALLGKIEKGTTFGSLAAHMVLTEARLDGLSLTAEQRASADAIIAGWRKWDIVYEGLGLVARGPAGVGAAVAGMIGDGPRDGINHLFDIVPGTEGTPFETRRIEVYLHLDRVMPEVPLAGKKLHDAVLDTVSWGDLYDRLGNDTRGQMLEVLGAAQKGVAELKKIDYYADELRAGREPEALTNNVDEPRALGRAHAIVAAEQAEQLGIEVENRFENELSDAPEQPAAELDLREEIEDAEPDAAAPEPLLLQGLDGEAMRRYFEEADQLRSEPSETHSDGQAQIEKGSFEINETQSSVFDQAPSFDPGDLDHLGLPKSDATSVPEDADVSLLWTDLAQPDTAREAEDAAQEAEAQTNTLLLLPTPPENDTPSEPRDPEQEWAPDEVVNEHPIPHDNEEADQPTEPDLAPQPFEPTPPINQAEAPQSITIPESVTKSEPEPVAAAEPPPTAAEPGKVVMADTPAAVESARVDLSPPPTSEKTLEAQPAESDLPDLSDQQIPAVECDGALDSAGGFLAGAAVSLLPGRVEKPRMVENVTPYSHEAPQFEVEQTDKDVAVEKAPPPPEQVQTPVENMEQTENAESAEGAEGAEGGTGGEGGDAGGDGGGDGGD